MASLHPPSCPRIHWQMQKRCTHPSTTKSKGTAVELVKRWSQMHWIQDLSFVGKAVPTTRTQRWTCRDAWYATGLLLDVCVCLMNCLALGTGFRVEQAISSSLLSISLCSFKFILLGKFIWGWNNHCLQGNVLLLPFFFSPLKTLNVDVGNSLKATNVHLKGFI